MLFWPLRGLVTPRTLNAEAHDILMAVAAFFFDWIDSRSSLNIMISVSNVSMRYGAKVLFDEVSTGFVPGKRYGLTGPNGAGKSTFMKLLTGELEPQKGTVVRPRKLGVLSQDQFAFDKPSRDRRRHHRQPALVGGSRRARIDLCET